MSDDDRIAKLQALLARVRSRSRPLRPSPLRTPARPSPGALEMATPLSAFHPSPLPPPPPPAPPAAAIPPPEPPPPPPFRPRYTPRPEVPAGLFAMRPQEPPFAQAAHADPLRNGGASWSTPIDPPPMEVIELEVDPDPSIPPPPVSGASLEDTNPTWESAQNGGHAAPEPLESRSRLVSAPPSPFEPLEPLEQFEPLEPLEPLELLDGGDAIPRGAPSDPTIEVAATEVSRAELEAIEQEQAPTSSRRPISMEEKMSELDDDVVPLHTPPPESGRLPAASPSIDLAFVQADVSVVRAEPPPRADVAVFVPTPRAGLGAKTFGELLDEALSL